MRNIISFLVLFSNLIFFVPNASAASATGVIQKAVTTKRGVMIVYFDSMLGSAPGCATLTTSHKRFATENPAQQSLLLAAYLAGHTVKIDGDDNCDAWGDTETIKYAWIWP